MSQKSPTWYPGQRKSPNNPDLSEETKSLVDASYGNLKVTTNGANFISLQPKFVSLRRAKVIKKYDSWIVLSGDAPFGPGTGYSKITPKCATIDLVVGRMASVSDASNNPQGYVMNSFKNDASRIYISQRSDIDKILNIAPGTVQNPEGKSAIALISDSIRLYGRAGIKLVTAEQGESLSDSGDVKTIPGIDLIAGNNDADMQPIPMGKNVAGALDKITKRIGELCSIINELWAAQQSFAQKLAMHTHDVPGVTPGLGAAKSIPSIDLASAVPPYIQAMVEQQINAFRTKTNAEVIQWVEDNEMGYDSINSQHNRTN